MVPEKKPNMAGHLSAMRALSHAAASTVDAAAAVGDKGAIGDVTGAGGAVFIPLRLKQERKTPGEGGINNVPTAVLHKMRAGGMSSIHLPIALVGAAAAIMPALVRVATPQLSL